MSKRHTIAQVTKALIEADGQSGLAAKALKISPQAVNERIRRSPELRQVLADLDTALIETARSGLAKAVRDGDRTLIKFVLERRDRAYSAKVETSFDEAQLEAFAASLGGDPKKLRSALDAVRQQRAAGGLGRS